MPKNGNNFDDTITFASFLEYREKLIAWQYFTGQRDFSDTVRNLLFKAIDTEIEMMDPGSARRFKQILESTKPQIVIMKQKRRERSTRVNQPAGDEQEP